MFIVLLKFAASPERAKALMQEHLLWLQRGFDEGAFVLAGSLAAGQGGAIIAHNVSREQLRQRVDDDPFVGQGVVRPEIVEIKPSRLDERLAFLAA